MDTSKRKETEAKRIPPDVKKKQDAGLESLLEDLKLDSYWRCVKYGYWIGEE